MNWLNLIITAFVLTLAGPGYSTAAVSIPHSLQDAVRSGGTVDCIVILDDSELLDAFPQVIGAVAGKADSPEEKRVARRERLTLLKRQVRGAADILDKHIRRDYGNFPLIYLNLDAARLEQLARTPRVKVIAENRTFKTSLNLSLPLIGAPAAQSGGAAGTGTSVAILDTGVNFTQSAFGPCTAPGVPSSCRVAVSLDIASGDGQLDDDGHGTNVAAIVLGVAPDTRIIGLDVFNGQSAYDGDLLAALDWVLDNRSTYNIVAVNMSLGDSSYNTATCPSDTLSYAVTELKSAGIATVAASGNDAYAFSQRTGKYDFTDGLSSPACVPDAIAVGAVYDASYGTVNATICMDDATQADKVACFSQTANYLALLAPGLFVSAGGVQMSGTSQATPHVAGAVALLKGVHPAITVQRLLGALTGGGAMVTDTRSNPDRFFPRLDIPGALLRFPRIETGRSIIDFGPLLPGSSPEALTLTVTNSGGIPLTIAGVSLNGAHAQEFSLTGDSCSNAAIAAGTGCSITVSHLPSALGTRNAALLIPSDDPDTPEMSIPLQSQDPRLFQVSASRSGYGSGSIVSSPSGISCGAVCTTPFLAGSGIILQAIPDGSSLFTGWTSGGCSGTGTCGLLVAGDSSVTAEFHLKPVLSDSGGYYSSLAAAYAALTDGGSLALQSSNFNETLTLDRSISFALTGGYDPAFGAVLSATTLTGSFTIARGSVTVDNLIIQ